MGEGVGGTDGDGFGGHVVMTDGASAAAAAPVRHPGGIGGRLGDGEYDVRTDGDGRGGQVVMTDGASAAAAPAGHPGGTGGRLGDGDGAGDAGAGVPAWAGTLRRTASRTPAAAIPESGLRKRTFRLSMRAQIRAETAK